MLRGVVMVPLYLARRRVVDATGDFAARNVFERRAGLADGGYTDKPLRASFRGRPTRPVSGSGPLAAPPGVPFPAGFSRTCRIDASPSR